MDDFTNCPKIIHWPLGEEHPYQQLPIERSPRWPRAGEAVSLGAAFSNLTDESVWVEWSVGNPPGSHRIKAQKTREWEGCPVWSAALPPFKYGSQVTYRFICQTGHMEYSSEPFTFSVPGWSPIHKLVDCMVTSDRIRLICEIGRAASLAEISFCLQEDGSLQITSRPGDRSHRDRNQGREAGEGHAATFHEHLALCLGHYHFRVWQDPFHFSVGLDDGPILEETTSPEVLLDSDGNWLEWRQSYISHPGEAFFGFGERFNAMDQRGNKLDMRVYEQWRSQGVKTYIPIPFFLSSNKYGYFVDSNRYMTFDLAHDHPGRWSVSAELGKDASFTSYFFSASKPKVILSWFSTRTGQSKLPPDWAFGLWMSSNDWDNQQRVMQEVAQTQEHRIPVTVLVIEAWSDEATFYIWNDALYTPRPGGEAFQYGDFSFETEGRWPAPKAMIDDLHKGGIRLVLWQIPVLKRLKPDQLEATVSQLQLAADEEYMIKKGFCVQNLDGSPYRVRPLWFHDSLLLDVTNPEAVQWWMSKRTYLLEELGVDGFKTDGGEHLFGRDLEFFDGRKGDELWNLYPVLYQQAYSRFALDKRRGDSLLFSRSGYTGAQANPCHWAGDEASTWEAFRATMLAGLNAGISGIPFWGWDIAGFSGEIPTAELYLRAAAAAVFTPIMQYHSEYYRQLPSRDRTPWNIQERTGDADVIPIFRFFANLRMNLLPYILSEARQCVETGLPLMRAGVVDFAADPTVREYPYQFLFGPCLLVAPVINPGITCQEIYLPSQTWYDFWTGHAVVGCQTIPVSTPKDRIPVFVRGGSVLPLNFDHTLQPGSPVGNRVDEYQQLCFYVFPEIGETIQEWVDPLSGQTFIWQIAYHPEENRLVLHIPAIPYGFILIIPGEMPEQTRITGAEYPFHGPWEEMDWITGSGTKRSLLHLPALPHSTTIELTGWIPPQDAPSSTIPLEI